MAGKNSKRSKNSKHSKTKRENRRPAAAGSRRRSVARLRPDSERGLEPGPGSDLGAAIRAAAGEPLELLTLVSTLLAATDPRGADPLAPSGPDERPTREQFVEAAIGIEAPEMSAVLGVLAVLVDDELTVARIRRELTHRQVPLPGFAAGPGVLKVARAVTMADRLGDGEDVALEIRAAGLDPFTMLVYVDHNLMSSVKDAFIVDDPLDTVVDLFLSRADTDDVILNDLTLPDARARIAAAIAAGAMMYPPLESDTWPAARPILEAAIRPLPTGGSGYARHEWQPAELDAISAEFAESAFGGIMDDPDDASIVRLLIEFAATYDAGDPWHYSPASVEGLLFRMAHKVMAPADDLCRAPKVLRPLIRFAHAERGVPAHLTAETIEAVDEIEPDYLTEVDDGSSSPTDFAQLRADAGHPLTEVEQLLLAGIGDDEDPLHWYRRVSYEHLVAQAGSDDALESLDIEPLPDEPVDTAAIDDDIVPAVLAIDADLDAPSVEIGGVELRTACRRLLTRAAVGDPRVFRRAGRSDTAAAAICWIVMHANGLLNASTATMTAKELWARFGVSAATGRAQTLLKAAGFRDDPDSLGDPTLLTSTRRAAMIAERDRLRAELGE